MLRLQSAARETGFCVWLWEKSVLAAKLLSKHELVCVCWAVLNLFSTASPLCYRADSVDTETRSPWQWWIHPWILMCCIWVQLAKANRENRALWWHQRVYSAPCSQSQISDGFINKSGLLRWCVWCAIDFCPGQKDLDLVQSRLDLRLDSAFRPEVCPGFLPTKDNSMMPLGQLLFPVT